MQAAPVLRQILPPLDRLAPIIDIRDHADVLQGCCYRSASILVSELARQRLDE
jgi:hypothetical protein